MPTVGDRLGPYLLRERLHRGSRAVLFAAEDTRDGRRVALKVLAADAACDCKEFRNLQPDRAIVQTPNHAVPRSICWQRDRDELGTRTP